MAIMKPDETWKDRLLENINSCVKKLQAESFNEVGRVSEVWIRLEDLCISLDQALSHGLRHSRDGYWPFVKEITHRSVIQHVLGYPTIISNSEKELMWLLLAINDRTLESFLSMMAVHVELARKHYLECALMRDEQRLRLLVVITSGLEHLEFNLDLLNATIAVSMIHAIIRKLAVGVDTTADVNSDETRVPDCRILELLQPDGPTSQLPEEEDFAEIIHSSQRFQRRKKKEEKILEQVLNDNKSHSLDSVIDDLNSNSISNAEESKDDKANEKVIEDYKSCKNESVSSTMVFHHESSTDFDDGYILEKQVEPNVELKLQLDDDAVVHVKSECGLPLLERGVPEGQEDPMSNSIVSGNGNTHRKSSNRVSWSPSIQDDDEDANNHRLKKVKKKKSNYLIPKPNKVDTVILEANTKLESATIAEELLNGIQRCNALMEGQIHVDNNTLLFLMLDVFEGSEEKFYKMFHFVSGSVTTEVSITYLVITDRNLYMVMNGGGGQHFDVKDKVSFDQIDFIQISVNYQAINLVCAAPRRRFWLRTGDANITRNIVASLDLALRRSPVVGGPPCILTDPVAHKISLVKWISQELKCELALLEICHYALVYWEDTQKSHSENEPAGPRREGYLMYRYSSETSSVKFSLWGPGYFILKAGVLYQFSNQHDRQVKSYVQLQDGMCGGCRRVPTANRPHVFELLLAGGRSLQLAAPDELDVSDWFCAFLQSASQRDSMVRVEPLETCVPCSLVLTNQKLFVCSEHLETGIITGLRSVNVTDIGAVCNDPEKASFCVMEFESVEATQALGDWIFYFASHQELEKFISALGLVWESVYQIPLARRTVLSQEQRERCQFGGCLRNQAWQKAGNVFHGQNTTEA